jgi:lipid II:glycine glycyltransferase (peptidoglycan interpeptide bridge formation enzyme)
MSFKIVSTHPLQSPEWGEFRIAWGNEVVQTKWGLITIHCIPYTQYSIGMFIKGPTPTQEMLTDLKKLAKEKNLIFIKLEPNVVTRTNNKEQSVEGIKLIKLLGNNGCVKGKTLFTPTSFWIDLTKSEEELMKGFSSKTRYNIRLAQRNGVKVVEDNSDNTFEKYLDLTRETVERQGFYAHTEKYHRLMWKYLHQSPITNHQPSIARLLFSKYNPPSTP